MATVLLVTRSDDNQSVGMVSEALRKRGALPLRLDTDLYPQEIRLSTSYGRKGVRRFVGTGEGAYELTEVTAVWYRRFAAGLRLPTDLGDTRSACVQESRTTLYGTIASLDCFQLDPLSQVRSADFKEHQLKLARELGLECPETLFTNDPEAALNFFAQSEGPVVTKMQSQFAIYREGSENVVFTSLVESGDLSAVEGLRFAPMMFQELVPKTVELRVTVVGKEVFAAAIDPSRSEAAGVDWRRNGVALIGDWEPYALPPEIEDRLLELTRAYGLNYAAADFIVTPEGRHVFLELNAAGEWFWLQLCPGLPIADAIARVLTDPGARG